jgi:NTE family protein
LPRPDNKHLSGFSLKETLQQFAHFPVKSTVGQPRFLLVTVDVQTGDAVTFDSYSNKAKYHNDTNSFIVTKNGIETDHVLASGTFPGFYDYPNFEVESKNEMTKTSDKERLIFWDGGIKSNTPLRELIQAHTDYWRDKTDHGIPDLEVYIADLWPSEIHNSQFLLIMTLSIVEIST